jgi:uncharacterized membrane protein YGL010W
MSILFDIFYYYLYLAHGFARKMVLELTVLRESMVLYCI